MYAAVPVNDTLCGLGRHARSAEVVYTAKLLVRFWPLSIVCQQPIRQLHTARTDAAQLFSNQTHCAAQGMLFTLRHAHVATNSILAECIAFCCQGNAALRVRCYLATGQNT